MIGTIAELGRIFGLLQDEGTMINLIGPMTVYRGDSLTLLLTVTDDEDERVDLTGLTVRLGIAASIGGDLLVDKTVGSGVTLLDQSEADTKGQATIEIATADTTRDAALYWLDVVVTDGADRQHVIAPREFTIAGTVTP